MTADKRLMLGLIGSFVYWTIAVVALIFILLPCGMGPEAYCEMVSPLTFWLTVAGFVLIYVALLLRLRNWK